MKITMTRQSENTKGKKCYPTVMTKADGVDNNDNKGKGLEMVMVMVNDDGREITWGEKGKMENGKWRGWKIRV